MGRVSAAAEASNVLLQLHLAARGAMAFLRSLGGQWATGYNHPKGFVYSIGSNPVHGVTPYMG